MALRLPTSTRSVRKASRTRSLLTIVGAAVVFVTLPLRLMLAAAQIADWTTSWKTVELVTMPFVGPFELVGPLNEQIVRNITLAEILATTVFVLVAIYFLALLTVRRRL